MIRQPSAKRFYAGLIPAAHSSFISLWRNLATYLVWDQVVKVQIFLERPVQLGYDVMVALRILIPSVGVRVPVSLPIVEFDVLVKHAGVMKLVTIADLKSAALRPAGSIPAGVTG